MFAGRCSPTVSWLGVCTIVIWTNLFCSQAWALKTQWIPFTSDKGTVYLDNNRRPALYTGDFGDCQGDSLINVTRFDASLYRDNLTVMFHMAGTTALKNEKVMLYFSVFAYGENRFSLTFNPCVINIPTLCPMNSSVPIEANGMIPIGQSDVAGIPSVAFSIPDFEGQAILRIFSNATQSQIACYSAVMKNGSTFSHPAAIGSILGLFTFVAFVCSLAVTIYGQFVPETRIHYAHSMSVFVVFAVFQHIFFTGALSMNWPSVLVAFWSNFAWSAGMIYSRKMQNSINQFIGQNRGNISMVGSAPTNQNFADLGGGFQLSQLYKRGAESLSLNSLQTRSAEHMLSRRTLVNSTSGFVWYGFPAAPGLPLPGNYSGFAGTLAQLDIPASNAFMTGLLWLLILIVIIGTSIVTAKWTIEALVKVKLLKTTQLDFFRSHWMQFTGAAVLRTCFIAFFMMTYLALFQFALGGGLGVIAVAAIVFTVFVVGMFGIAAYSVWYRLRHSKSHTEAGQSTGLSKSIVPWRKPHLVTEEGQHHVHDDQDYLIKFGWLSSRFRRSKWWFFTAWLVYEVGRACFYGGAAGHPLTQVFGLLAWEILAFIAIVIARPFESNRLNLLMVYFLGFSKVATVALSCAFDPRFKLSRILTTVIGVVIIVIQGVLTICLLIGILAGAISSYMSIKRNHEEFKPVRWTNLRLRYFSHIEQKATDKPRPPPPPPPPEPEKPTEPYFTVSSVRREPKIEDENEDEKLESSTVAEVYEVDPSPSQDEVDRISAVPNYPYMSRTESIRSRTSIANLPPGARHHRRSWSVRDLAEPSSEQISSGLHSRMSVESIREAPNRYRSGSMKENSRSEFPYAPNAERSNRRSRRVRSSSNPLSSRRSGTQVMDIHEVNS